MVQEPDATLRWILFERNGVTVDDLHDIVNGCSQQSSYDSLISLFQVDSVEVIHDGQQNQWMDICLSDWDF